MDTQTSEMGARQGTESYTFILQQIFNKIEHIKKAFTPSKITAVIMGNPHLALHLTVTTNEKMRLG